MKRVSISFLFLLFFLSSCQTVPFIQDFDSEAWKKDFDACEGLREKVVAALKEEKEKLKSMTESQTLQLLGRPNQVELGERNRKVYIYYIQKGQHCSDNLMYNTEKLILKFNAVNLITEITFE